MRIGTTCRRAARGRPERPTSAVDKADKTHVFQSVFAADNRRHAGCQKAGLQDDAELSGPSDTSGPAWRHRRAGRYNYEEAAGWSERDERGVKRALQNDKINGCAYRRSPGRRAGYAATNQK